jgi:fatty-acyl-CoA synthase
MAGLAVPDRDDEEGADADAHGGGADLLRHDETSPVIDADLGGRFGREARDDGRRVHPHLELKVVDPETGRSSRAARRRAVHARLQRDARLLGRRAATRAAIDAAGWMHTGDLAVMDDDGYVYIVGRIKDMIIRGGENIYPREIEEFLLTLPTWSRRTVIGVPSERYGEEVMAWVKLRDGARPDGDSLAESCRGAIATFKIPRYWKLVDEFPMTVTGKIQKFKMREAAIDELGLEAAAAIRTA